MECQICHRRRGFDPLQMSKMNKRVRFATPQNSPVFKPHRPQIKKMEQLKAAAAHHEEEEEEDEDEEVENEEEVEVEDDDDDEEEEEEDDDDNSEGAGSAAKSSKKRKVMTKRVAKRAKKVMTPYDGLKYVRSILNKASRISATKVEKMEESMRKFTAIKTKHDNAKLCMTIFEKLRDEIETDESIEY